LVNQRRLQILLHLYVQHTRMQHQLAKIAPQQQQQQQQQQTWLPHKQQQQQLKTRV
jgi:hypothetical protein